MVAGQTERPRRRGLGWISGLLVVLLIAGGAVSWQQGWAEQWWDQLRDRTGDPADPAAVAPPPEVDVPPVLRPRPVAQTAQLRSVLDAAAIEAAVSGDLADKDLGRNVLAAVAPLRGAGLAYESSSSGKTLAIPASTTKVVTAAVALALLGGGHRFRTRTVLESRPAGGPAELVLVGGGDPFLASAPEPDDGDATFDPDRADIRTLAERTARALREQGTRTVRLGYDTSLFSGPSVNPHWRADYIPDDVVSPISPLWVDEGRSLTGYGRDDDPAAAAAAAFASQLATRGITVVGGPTSVTAASDATPVATVTGPTLDSIVQRVLEVSDNEAAEVLLRHIGLAAEGEGSFEAGQDGVRRTLTAHGIDVGNSVLYDGSGLSRDNRMSPRLLVDVLRWAAAPNRPELRTVLSSLPVAGFTGSLTNRMDRGPADGRGRVRAKTGTLTGVTSLAGIAVDLDGDLIVFALMADRVPKNKDVYARIAQDNAAAALGACRCAA